MHFNQPCASNLQKHARPHLPALPLHGARRYSIKVSVHNGRTFVGPSYNLQNISAMDVSGWKVLQVSREQAVMCRRFFKGES